MNIPFVRPRLILRALILFYAGFVICAPLGFAATNFSSAKKSTRAIQISSPSKGYFVGEKLHFDVSWMGVPIGYGQIEIKEVVLVRGIEAYHIVATAQTNDALSKIYPVKDEIHSWIDRKTLTSLKFRKILSEGRYRADEEVEFFPENKIAVYSSRKNGTRKEYPISGPTHDIVSAFYWFRTLSVNVGESVKTQASSEEKNWEVVISVLETTSKVIRGLGPVDTFCVEPKTSFKGALYSRGRVWIYFRSDSSRTPVWVSLKTPFGPIQGVISAKNSRFST